VRPTASRGWLLSRTRNGSSFRRPTWPSNTCSRRTRRKRSRRSTSGLNTRPQRSPGKAPQRSTEMKTNAKDYVSAAQQFFTAYDAHDVDGMLALCADGALGRYAPYGRESVVPIRGGIDVIWRAFPNAVPNFRVKVIELIAAEGNTVVIQAEMSGPIPAEVP